MSSDAGAALRELRRLRTRNRIGDTEWFEIAYRVYLFALVGLIIVVTASDAIEGIVSENLTTEVLLSRGPSVLGLGVMVAVAIGLRSGADGGPISVEPADVRHVLLAPLDRRSVLFQPATQRFRSVMFALAMGAGVLGQLVGREVEGSRPAWAAACAAYGAILGAAVIAPAIIAHALRLPRWAASGIGAVLLAWQGVAVWATWNDELGDVARAGPADLAGSIALWGVRQRPIDLLAALAALAAIAVALALLGRMRLEPLVRRGELVSQLRFAATAQDLRTVVLLRRQLRAEAPRAVPWGGRRPRVRRPADRVAPTAQVPAPARRAGSVPVAPAALARIIWRRGVASVRRLPASRLVRLLLLAITGGIFASLTTTASPLYALGLLAAVFVAGMESIEPLSEEVDRPDLTDGLPVERGAIYARHLMVPALTLAVVGLVGAAVATAMQPDSAAVAFALAIPTVWLGALGPIVSTVLDAPLPLAAAGTNIFGSPRGGESPFAMAEFAGFSTAFSTIAPVVLSAIGIVPVLVMRLDASPGAVLRVVVGTFLVLAAAVWWVRRRDKWGAGIRAFFEEGRAMNT